MDDKKWNEYVHEAKIIQFPRKKYLSDQDMGFVIALEEELHRRLIIAHGGRADDVPVEYVDVVDGILDQIEEMLRH